MFAYFGIGVLEATTSPKQCLMVRPFKRVANAKNCNRNKIDKQNDCDVEQCDLTRVFM